MRCKNSVRSFLWFNDGVHVVKKLRDAARFLYGGGVGVVPTDTIYGISCIAARRDLVERIYELKNRDKEKPLILLISGYDQLEDLGIMPTREVKDVLSHIWPGPYSVLFEVSERSHQELLHIHRGVGKIAIRMPASPTALHIARLVGPIVSTSVNREGEIPAKSVEEAVEMFGESLDFYLDEGPLENPPSKVVEIIDGELCYIRE